MTMPSALKYVRPLLAGLVAAGLLAGFAAKLVGLGAWSGAVWAAVTLPVLLALLGRSSPACGAAMSGSTLSRRCR